MSENDNVSIFDRYTAKAKSKETTDQANTPKPRGSGASPYRAMEIDENRTRSMRLCIEYADGASDAFPYAHLIQISCTSSRHLILCFSHCIISLEGEGIEALFEPLGDEQVRYLRCYNAKRFLPPKEGEPIIETITYQNIRELAGSR